MSVAARTKLAASRSLPSVLEAEGGDFRRNAHAFTQSRREGAPDR